VHFSLDFFYNSFECNYNSTNTINNQITLGWLLGFKGPYLSQNIKATTKTISKQYCTTVNDKTYQYTCNELKKQGFDDISNIYTGDNFYPAESIFDPHFNSYFLISINDFMNNHNNIYISPFKNQCNADQNIIARIPSTMHNSSLHNTMDKSNYPERKYFGPTDINKLEIKLYDEYGRIVDINHADYSFVLELELLYEN